MKVGDLVKAWAIVDNKAYIGMVTSIEEEIGLRSVSYRYKVFFPNAPHGWWNEGTWNKKALELV